MRRHPVADSAIATTAWAMAKLNVWHVGVAQLLAEEAVRPDVLPTFLAPPGSVPSSTKLPAHCVHCCGLCGASDPLLWPNTFDLTIFALLG